MAITSGNTSVKSSANVFQMGTSDTERMRWRGAPSGLLLNTTTSIHSFDVEGSIYHLENSFGDAVQHSVRNTSAPSARYTVIGMTTPGEFLFYGNTVYGVYKSYNGTSWFSSSDERLKTDLTPISNAAQKVSQLRTVIGRYKTDEPSVRRAFLIAQDVQQVFPEAVDVPEDPERPLGLSYVDVLPLVTAAVKELNTELENSIIELNTLQTELDQVKLEINALKGA